MSKFFGGRQLARCWKIVAFLMVAVCLIICLTGCDSNYQDMANTIVVSQTMAERQPTPTDITYSLSRYNLIRRAYVQSGNEEKARNLPCEVEKEIAYIYLFVDGAGCVKRDTVDGIPTSMRSYLTPDSQSIASGSWLADVDGTYGDNPDGIFYFDADGEYHEWVGEYYFSKNYYDIPNPYLTNVIESYQ